MKLSEIKVIAVDRGIKTGKMNKIELVRAIQETEGNPACFARGEMANCNQSACLWRQDCN